MDTKVLRQKILDLAIRGKLVPQDPNDEPASVLLKRIREQKMQMVKDGKLKAKDIKNDTIIFKGADNLHYEQFADGSVKCIEDEIPFELPERWVWCRIRNIASVKGGKRLPKGESFSDDITDHAYIRVTDMKNRSINTCGLRYISEEVFAKIQSYTIGKNDLYVTIAGTIGVVGEVPEILDGMNLTENAVRVCNISINKTFLCYVMLSELVQQQFQEKTHQVAMPKLALERILGTLIPVCPVKEQQHIVFAINRALQIADTIEIQKDVLFELVAATKSKILDLAIRGKLVPQDPNDEPASVLLERIRAKKEELIKQGKIKRDKKESVIFKGDDNSYYEKIGNKITCIDDFLPFDIPDTWTWARLKNIGDVIGGGTPKTNNPNYWDGEIPWVTPADLSGYENMYLAQGSRFITELGLKESSAQLLPKDSVLFSSRAPIGYIAIAENAIATNQGFKSVSPYISGMSEYLYYCLRRCTNDIIQRASGTTFKEISGSEMSETLVPISSLNEQKKIVNRISDLFAVINNVEASLN